MLAIFHGVPWVHTLPALLTIVFAFLYLKTKWLYLKAVFLLLWLLFLPNTAYIFTDVVHITLHWNSVNSATRFALIIQYIVLELIGLVTFLLAMLPSENIIHVKHLSKKEQVFSIILLNFFIGFGMTLGRTGYTNSYIVFTQPTKVVLAATNIITTFNLLGLAIGFGVLCNCIYFLFRNMIIRHARKLL